MLIVGEERGEGIKAIAQGLAIGAVFKILVSGFQVVQGVVQTGFAKGRSVVYAGSDMSVALLAVGYIVNLQVASLIMLGGAIGWFVAIPILGGFAGGGAAEAVAHADELWSSQVRYIGVGAMLVGGLWSIFQVRHGIVAGVTALKGVGSGVEETKVLRTCLLYTSDAADE